jgi:hypothetical protein
MEGAPFIGSLHVGDPVAAQARRIAMTNTSHIKPAPDTNRIPNATKAFPNRKLSVREAAAW